MFFDARNMIRDLAQQMDVCVVGAGIAGLVIARRLAETGLSVWLIESGDRKFAAKPQSLNEGRSNNRDYPFLSSRERVFGGTSTRWYGACIELDSSDFEARDWLPYSGWPITAADLDAPMQATRQDFGVTDDRAAFEASLQIEPFADADLEAKAVSYSEPLDLGTRYRDLVERSETVHCLLNATVTEIFPDRDATRIEEVEISVEGAEPVRVKPRMVILAGGGIENPRLLLASSSVHPKGVGNAHDVVGRYHMEHPIRTVGVLPVGARYREFLMYTNRADGNLLQGTFGLSSATRRKEQVLDLHVRCYRYSAYEDAAPIISGKVAAHGKERGAARLKSAMSAIHPTTVGYLMWHAKNKVLREAAFDHIRMTAFVEQEPDPNNRITLSQDRDMFGRPLPHLQFEESAFMLDSIQRTMAKMGAAFERAGLPGLRYKPEELAHLQHYNAYGLHPMGTTRMATDPQVGVVDKECRVHGHANLFIAGSSVFPTGGAANPSWAIAALALRTADEVVRQIRNL